MQGPEGLNVFAAVGPEEFDIPTDNGKKTAGFPPRLSQFLSSWISHCAFGFEDLVSIRWETSRDEKRGKKIKFDMQNRIDVVMRRHIEECQTIRHYCAFRM